MFHLARRILSAVIVGIITLPTPSALAKTSTQRTGATTQAGKSPPNLIVNGDFAHWHALTVQEKRWVMRYEPPTAPEQSALDSLRWPVGWWWVAGGKQWRKALDETSVLPDWTVKKMGPALCGYSLVIGRLIWRFSNGLGCSRTPAIESSCGLRVKILKITIPKALSCILLRRAMPGPTSIAGPETSRIATSSISPDRAKPPFRGEKPTMFLIRRRRLGVL